MHCLHPNETLFKCCTVGSLFDDVHLPDHASEHDTKPNGDNGACKSVEVLVASIWPQLEVEGRRQDCNRHRHKDCAREADYGFDIGESCAKKYHGAHNERSHREAGGGVGDPADEVALLEKARAKARQ